MASGPATLSQLRLTTRRDLRLLNQTYTQLFVINSNRADGCVLYKLGRVVMVVTRVVTD